MITYLHLWTAYWREYIYIYTYIHTYIHITWSLVRKVDISSKYFNSVPIVTNYSSSKRPLTELTWEFLCFALDFKQKRNFCVIYSASTFIWLNIATYD
jgi:hypothetical protein